MRTFRLNKVVAMDISHSHPNSKHYNTDAYYAKLANLLLDDFKKLRLDLGHQTAPIMRYAAIELANYMEDIVADSGQWRSLSALCQQMLGQAVPMYHDENNEHLPDEPSLDAVRFLVWHAATEMDDIWWHADDSSLKKMAMVAFDRLDSTFEQAPVNDELADDITDVLRRAGEDFQNVRHALLWIFNACYLTRSYTTERLLAKRLEEADSMSDMMPEAPTRMYYAFMHSIFGYKVGPLALEPREYVAAMMRTKSMLREAGKMMDMEVLPMGHYKYTVEDNGQQIQMLRTNGKKIQVARDLIPLDDATLRQYDGCSAIFVKYLGAWHLNGIFVPIRDIDRRWDRLLKDDHDYKAEGELDVTGEMLLKQSGGKEIMYFKDTQEMKHYLMKNMQFPSRYLDFTKERHLEDKYPLMFIDKDAKRFALHVSFGFTPCIADPANPYYDASVAPKESIELLWNDGISTEVVLYLLDHNYITAIYDDPMFCQESSLKQKQADARFLLRYMRKENY